MKISCAVVCFYTNFIVVRLCLLSGCIEYLLWHCNIITTLLQSRMGSEVVFKCVAC